MAAITGDIFTVYAKRDQALVSLLTEVTCTACT